MPAESALGHHQGGGATRGAFSYFLGETLRTVGGAITYRDLFARSAALVRDQAQRQSPQLDATVTEDLLGPSSVERSAPASAPSWPRGFLEELPEQELEAALGRGRHERGLDRPKGYRHGTRERHLVGRQLRPGADQGAARPDGCRGRRHAGMAQGGAAPLRRTQEPRQQRAMRAPRGAVTMAAWTFGVACFDCGFSQVAYGCFLSVR